MTICLAFHVHLLRHKLVHFINEMREAALFMVYLPFQNSVNGFAAVVVESRRRVSHSGFNSRLLND